MRGRQRRERVRDREGRLAWGWGLMDKGCGLKVAVVKGSCDLLCERLAGMSLLILHTHTHTHTRHS